MRKKEVCCKRNEEDEEEKKKNRRCLSQSVLAGLTLKRDFFSPLSF